MAAIAIDELLGLALPDLVALAGDVRDRAWGRRITYSPKVFIPLTMLCRDRCGYCTFAKAPARVCAPYLSSEQVLEMLGAILALAKELRPGTIDRVMEKTDIELGMEYFLRRGGGQDQNQVAGGSHALGRIRMRCADTGTPSPG